VPNKQQKRTTKSSKKKIWFKDITPNNEEKSDTSQVDNLKKNNKEKSSTQESEEKAQKSGKISFQQRLLTHLGDFIQIVTTACCNKYCFKGVLCQVESNFITMIDSLIIIEIPIDKIVAIILKKNGTLTENKLPYLHKTSSQNSPHEKEIEDKTIDPEISLEEYPKD
jgi:hypothetical protein